MTIKLPKDVSNIINTLQDAGYEAYAVGGCVRDSILGREPDDWDITTIAAPAAVKALFARTIDTGIQHGTVTVLIGNTGYEVTTYRIDGVYEDSRHPKEVTFTASLEEDLKRRDFTINAMAYNDKDGLIDCFDGRKDLKEGIIRCVGNPTERFTEDALRMMRAVRFSAQLGFAIEERTRAAISTLAQRLMAVSAERIQTELVKLVTSPHPDYLRVAYETGITAVIFPEFDAAMKTPQNHPHHIYCVGEHVLHSMLATPPDRVLRLAMLFHDLGKPLVRTTDAEGIDHFRGHAAISREIAENVLRRLRFDNDTKKKVTLLVRYHDYPIEETQKALRYAAHTIGVQLLPLLFLVKRADASAQSDYRREEKLQRVERLEGLYQKILEQKQCLSLKELAVNGKDLMALGMKPGREIGETLERLLLLVLENPEYNTKEYLLTQV